MKVSFKIFKGSILIGLTLFLFNSTVYSQGSTFYYFQSPELFRPIQASIFESKIGISSNTNDENVKLDIGATVDLLGLRNTSYKASLSAEFFTFSNLRSEANFKFPVDAIDYYFGMSFNYKYYFKNRSSTISSRLRFAHISSHFEDGHKFARTDTIFVPVVYSREFIELAGIYDYRIRTNFVLRTLLGVNFLMHSIPDDFGKVSVQIGNELRYSINKIFGVYLSNELRSATVKGNSNFNESFEIGINVGGFDNRGVNIFFSVYNGQDYKGQYYDKALNIKSLGTHIIFSMIFLLLINILLYFNSPQGGVLVKQFEVKGFQNAVSLSPDNLGKVYVLDNKANQVIKFNENLVEVKRNGKQGWSEGLFDTPTSIDASTGLDIFICDGKNNRVQRFDRNLNYVSSLVTNLTTFLPQYQFNNPISSILMNSNDMYVLDKDNNRVVIFKSGLTPSNSFGEYQNSNDRIISGKKMVKDKNNFIFIHDAGQNAVLKFDNFGSFMKKIQVDTIYSISVYDNSLYLLTNNKIYSYNIEKNTFEDYYDFIEYKTISDFTDFVVLNKEKYLILEKNKLSYWKLINKN